MRRIDATECLRVGDRVQVGSRVGVVVAADLVPARPCGEVARHKVKFTHRKKSLFRRSELEPLKKETIESVSYVAIWAL